MPPRPKIVRTDKNFSRILESWPTGVAQSDIWDASERERVKKGKCREGDILERRSKNPQKGVAITPTEQDSRIPILLMARRVLWEATAGTSPRDYGSGWDIVIPAGWGMAFWKSLSFCGCKVFGLRDEHSVAFEARRPFFPIDAPDSDAGKVFAHALALESAAAYQKRPPAKRVNYAKHEVSSPWIPPFETLIPGPEGARPEMFVLRGEPIITALRKLLFKSASFDELASSLTTTLTANPKFVSEDPVDLQEAFVMVSVDPVSFFFWPSSRAPWC